MAPSPEYDKEPKAPDKSATHISSEDTKLLHNLVNDQHNSSDHKTINSATNSEVENKYVETLDDEKLRALLDEAITYKCPKDREGKSNLFKELLEEVEQDEQACEAAARNLAGCHGSNLAVRSFRPIPHSNSLQDLVAALVDPTYKSTRILPRQQTPTPSNVSARTKHGGSLPSGVDTSSLLNEEGSGSGSGAGYLATVRCVNPPPLAERRVSASDANAPQELEQLNKRSKPQSPMTYTARATLEIGSGSVCSGRAVTTTTASNQVRTQALPAPRAAGRARSLPHTHGPRSYRGGGARASGKRPRGPTDRADRPHRTHMRTVDEWYRGLANYDSCALRSQSAPIAAESHHVRCNTDRCARPSHYPDYEVGSDGNLYRVEGRSRFSDNYEGDISVRRNRGEIGKGLVAPTASMINLRNVKSMTIGKPLSSFKLSDSPVIAEKATDNGERNDNSKADINVTSNDSRSDFKENVSKNSEICIEIESEFAMSVEDQTSKCFQMSNIPAPAGGEASAADCIELEEIVCHRANKHNDTASSFTEYLAGQTKLLQAIEAADATPAPADDEYSINIAESNNNVNRKYSERDTARDVSSDNDLTEIERIELGAGATGEDDADCDTSSLVPLNRKADDRAGGDRYILAELPNNAYIFLTLPKRLLNKDDRELHEIESNNNLKSIDNKKRRKDKVPVGTSSSKRTDTINKNALRVLLFENFLKSDREIHGSADNEVDSAIPFSCITTPEVVASCNTTSSSSSAVAIDPKPLQLSAGYRAVASLTECASSAAVSPSGARPSSSAQDAPELQPRSVTASSFNGLPLSRPNYGSTASSNDEFKKSLDENGNAVQGTSSPLSGSSQPKKPRRKKSSKNETVIDCQQLDGYRGDKADVNELLRFIESNPETRGPKMRAKHKDDTDDKATKKRSSDRRKDKEKVKRASSLEELSRTKLEDLTAQATPAPKPERRSWGDTLPTPSVSTPTSAPTPPLEPLPPPEPTPTPSPTPEPEPKQLTTPPPETEPEIYEPIDLAAFELPVLPVVEQADFQTVTKKRKPRRRTEEAPRRTRQPSPRRQESAPASDRSNDSNDDMDSVHSLPQPGANAPPPAPLASYADIARTRHNIPDLIESCNYYTEGENHEVIQRVEAPAPIETDYPALETRISEPPPPLLPRRREMKQGPPPRRDRKERVMQTGPPPTPDCPAPDVVADRRPPVILLDSNSRPRDMDGVTFGFDINEQLLVSGGSRRVRCDLVLDAVEPTGAAGLAVRAACRPLRYLPPQPPSDPHHLHQIIDYVGAAWEEVLRCGGSGGGGGKVRYFSE